MPAGIRVLYRIVQGNPPTRADMLSYQELGIAPDSDDPEMRRLPPARRVFIAELHIPPNAPMTLERTGSQPGHHALWGNADDILGYVVRLIPSHDSGTGETR